MCWYFQLPGLSLQSFFLMYLARISSVRMGVIFPGALLLLLLSSVIVCGSEIFYCIDLLYR